MGWGTLRKSNTHMVRIIRKRTVERLDNIDNAPDQALVVASSLNAQHYPYLYSVRFFIAIELAPELKEHLTQLLSEVRSEFPEVSWLSTDQLFLIIKFLGNPERRARKGLEKNLSAAGAQVAPFNISLSQLGCFPDRDPVRTLWVGVREDSYMLVRFQHDVEEYFAKLGLPREDKEFVPHIVLGRVSGKTPKGPLRRKFCELPLTHTTQHCTECCLVLSKLTASGPNYEIVKRAPFSAQIAR